MIVDSSVTEDIHNLLISNRFNWNNVPTVARLSKNWAFIDKYGSPENEIMVSTLTGCTGSPSVAIKVSLWPSIDNFAGHTDEYELIILNRYLLPGVIVNTSRGVLVTTPVVVSLNRPFPLMSTESGLPPVPEPLLMGSRPGNLSIAYSWNQSVRKIICVIRSKSYKLLLGSLEGGWRTIRLPWIPSNFWRPVWACQKWVPALPLHWYLKQE